MKNLLIILIMLLISHMSFAFCVNIENTGLPEKCLEINKNYCPKGTILTLKEERPGYHIPKCISCELEDSILIIPNCTSVEEVKKICPNRYMDYDCFEESILECDEPMDKKNHICHYLSINEVY